MWQPRAQRGAWKGHAMPMTWDQVPLSQNLGKLQITSLTTLLISWRPPKGTLSTDMSKDQLRLHVATLVSWGAVFHALHGDLSSPNQTVKAGRWMSETIPIPKDNLIPDSSSRCEQTQFFICIIYSMLTTLYERRSINPFYTKRLETQKS